MPAAIHQRAAAEFTGRSAYRIVSAQGCSSKRSQRGVCRMRGVLAEQSALGRGVASHQDGSRSRTLASAESCSPPGAHRDGGGWRRSRDNGRRRRQQAGWGCRRCGCASDLRGAAAARKGHRSRERSPRAGLHRRMRNPSSLAGWFGIQDPRGNDLSILNHRAGDRHQSPGNWRRSGEGVWMRQSGARGHGMNRPGRGRGTWSGRPSIPSWSHVPIDQEWRPPSATQVGR